MTEAELLSIGQDAWGNVNALVAIFLSVLTGYLVVAYSAGKNLTSSQVVIINSFFMIVSLFLLAGQWSFTQFAIEAELEAIKMSAWRTSPVYPFISYGLGVIYISFVLVSLKFMSDVRKGRK